MASRVIFCGTAEIACPSLKALAANPEFQIVAVVSQPDKPRGRKLLLQPSAVKALALELNLPVLQPARARDPGFIEEVRKLQPDLMVVIAYGQILPESLLNIPRFGCLNVHTSILPKHRGAAPIQWAIWSGDPETGVTIMKMDAGLDTGPILSIRTTPILPEDNAQTLHDRLALLGSELLLKTIPGYLDGTIVPRVQPEGATYARKISREDGRIQWEKPAEVIWRQLRAVTPWPGAFTWLQLPAGTQLIKVWEAHPEAGSSAPGQIVEGGKSGILAGTGDGLLRITSLQPEGGRRMPAAAFLAGRTLGPDAKFLSTLPPGGAG